MNNGRRYGLQLLRKTIKELGRSYVLANFGIAVLGLVVLLPLEFLKSFAQFTQLQTSFPSAVTAPLFLWRFVLLGFLVSLAVFISSFLTKRIAEHLRLMVEAKVRGRVLASINALPIEALDSIQRSDWFHQATADLLELEAILAQVIPNQVRQIALVFGVSILFFAVSGLVGWVPLVAALAFSGMTFFIQGKVVSNTNYTRDLYGRTFQSLRDAFEGIRTVRSQRAERLLDRRFAEKVELIQRASIPEIRKRSLLFASNEFLGQMMVGLVLTVVAYTIFRFQLTFVSAMTYPIYLSLFYGAAKALGSSARDLQRFLDRESPLVLLLEDSQPSISFSVFDNEVSQRIAVIKVTDLMFGYDIGRSVRLDQLVIERGRSWAIVGPSGSGKSTLLEVLAGIRPSMGGRIVLIDDAGKIAFDSVGNPRASLPLGVGAYVEQRPYIVEGTLRANLLVGNTHRLTDAELWRVATQTGLAPFVNDLGGFDVELIDRGKFLSEGERYRIALARALLMRQPFLLLDEPFASLDRASVDMLIEALKSLSGTVGVIIVTHYLPREFSVDGLISVEHSRAEVVDTQWISKLTGNEANVEDGSEEEFVLPETGPLSDDKRFH